MIGELQSNLISLGLLSYELDAIPKILELIERNLKNDNWRIKLRAVSFMEVRALDLPPSSPSTALTPPPPPSPSLQGPRIRARLASETRFGQFQ